jgi:hypothetical protein
MKQCRQESELKFLMHNQRILNVRKIVTDRNLNWEVCIERICSRIVHNLHIIIRLSKIFDINVRRMLYYGLIYSLLAYGIAVYGQITNHSLNKYLS